MEMHHHYSIACYLLLPVVRRATRESTSRHTAAVELPPSNTAGHNRTFSTTASYLRNKLPEEIFATMERDKLKTEINAFRCALASAPRVERDSCSAKEEEHIEKILSVMIIRHDAFTVCSTDIARTFPLREQFGVTLWKRCAFRGGFEEGMFQPQRLNQWLWDRLAHQL